MHYRILELVTMLMLVVSVWSCSEYEAEKERLWNKLSDNQYANLTQCLDYAKEVPGLVEKCREMEETVNKTVGN